MIVLDTHTWVWWVGDPERLSGRAATAIDGAIAEQKLFVSSISVWEVATLVDKKRLVMTLDVGDWIAKCESLPFINFVPVDNHIAFRSRRLPGSLHDDPADRMIVATALSLGATLVTKDRRLRDYGHVETLW